MKDIKPDFKDFVALVLAFYQITLPVILTFVLLGVFIMALLSWLS